MARLALPIVGAYKVVVRCVQEADCLARRSGGPRGDQFFRRRIVPVSGDSSAGLASRSSVSFTL